MNLKIAKSALVPPLLMVLISPFFALCHRSSNSAINKEVTPWQRKVFVSPGWLKDQRISDTNLMVVKAMPGGPSGEYIPGSIHVNTDEIEYDEFRPRTGTPLSELGRTTTEEQDQAKGLSASDSLPKNWWNLYPDEYLLKAIAYMGITISSKVVVYGESPDPAARLAWCLKYAGIEQVYFLNGGLKAWINTGNSTTTSPSKRTPVPHFGAVTAVNQKYLATTEYIRGVVSNCHPNDQIVDVRTYNEHIGEDYYYQYITTKGRIHNSLFGKDTANGDLPVTGFYGENHEILLPAIETFWQEAGITPDKQVSFYCGTGWRSSLAWLIAYSLGYDNIKNYDGGWYKWSMGPDKYRNPSDIGGQTQRD